MQRLAIFGGTFDPIHLGHLKTSLCIQETFKFDSYIFLPCKIPTLKPPSHANPQQRIEMLQLALEPLHAFKIDLREINRDTPSYMVDTLQSFRKEYPNDSITLILGFDAFISLPHWYQWEKLITLSHLLVIQRAGWSEKKIPKALEPLVSKHQGQSLGLQGTLSFFEAGLYEFSSSQIREELKKGLDVSAILPNGVYQYIKQKGLYQ